MVLNTSKSWMDILQTIGTIDDNIPKNKNGTNSKFLGVIQSQIENSILNMGLLRYNWKRTIGVDKINHAFHLVNQTDLDGALIIGSIFSESAINHASRINQYGTKKIILLDDENMNALLKYN